jgi:hypothetical protein
MTATCGACKNWLLRESPVPEVGGQSLRPTPRVAWLLASAPLASTPSASQGGKSRPANTDLASGNFAAESPVLEPTLCWPRQRSQVRLQGPEFGSVLHSIVLVAGPRTQQCRTAASGSRGGLVVCKGENRAQLAIEIDRQRAVLRHQPNLIDDAPQRLGSLAARVSCSFRHPCRRSTLRRYSSSG